MRQKRLWLYLIAFLLLKPLYSAPVFFTESVWESERTLFNNLGVRNFLTPLGINVLPMALFDLNWPASGGIEASKYPKYQFVFDLQTGFDLNKVIKLKGARLFFDFQLHYGQNVSRNNVGDFQLFDNVEAYNFVEIAQLWYQQVLFKDEMMITFGKIDVAPIFGYTPFAQTLVNSSYTQIPTILGYPSYPNPAVGLVLSLRYKTRHKLKTSVFDGSNALGVKTGLKGANPFFNNLKNHMLLLSEYNTFWHVGKYHYKGGLGAGVWGLIAEVPKLSGGSIKNTMGVYFYGYQTIWREITKPCNLNKERVLGGFSQIGVSNKKVSTAKVYIGKALTIDNVVRKFNKDSLSVGMATVIFSNTSGVDFIKRYEMSLEATYQFSFSSWLQVQPDIQWIIHPGGNGNPNAIVATIRLIAGI